MHCGDKFSMVLVKPRRPVESEVTGRGIDRPLHAASEYGIEPLSAESWLHRDIDRKIMAVEETGVESIPVPIRNPSSPAQDTDDRSQSAAPLAASIPNRREVALAMLSYMARLSASSSLLSKRMDSNSPVHSVEYVVDLCIATFGHALSLIENFSNETARNILHYSNANGQQMADSGSMDASRRGLDSSALDSLYSDEGFQVNGEGPGAVEGDVGNGSSVVQKSAQLWGPLLFVLKVLAANLDALESVEEHWRNKSESDAGAEGVGQNKVIATRTDTEMSNELVAAKANRPSRFSRDGETATATVLFSVPPTDMSTNREGEDLSATMSVIPDSSTIASRIRRESAELEVLRGRAYGRDRDRDRREDQDGDDEDDIDGMGDDGGEEGSESRGGTVVIPGQRGRPGNEEDEEGYNDDDEEDEDEEGDDDVVGSFNWQEVRPRHPLESSSI